ncbi:RHS repeat-associated core domain-containing protein [Serratia fonticola]|uniref:RHS repeat-associated core domain-containing protein n=1 Tax=Serratia fonticola TaxID=47917 RepID=UPI0015C66D03|nr:RHS repeat-associated core domain-containing protein [Serratia fonticola]NYA44659.1 RHS repeat-associated core domain-containing protein [Serratia fonticola]
MNRYYDPGIGRYLTADPVKLDGGLNSYQYVDGNPVSWVDPLGLFKTDVTGVERSSVNTGAPQLPEIPWSSASVKRASDELDRGALEVTVRNRSEAEELFRGKYVGEGYRNAESFNSVTAKDYFKVNLTTKEPYYHWDDTPMSDIQSKKIFMANHDINDAHGALPHLQLHPTRGRAMRIYWPNTVGNK